MQELSPADTSSLSPYATHARRFLPLFSFRAVIFSDNAYLCATTTTERQTEQIGFRQRHVRRGGSCERRPRVCHKRQETLAPVNNPIKMNRKRTPGTLSTCPPLSPPLLLQLLLSPRRLHRRNCIRVMKPAVDSACSNHNPSSIPRVRGSLLDVSCSELILIDALTCDAIFIRNKISFHKLQCKILSA